MNARLEIGTLVALVTIASLVIDRVVSGTLLLLSFSKRFPDPSTGGPEQRVRAEKILRLAAWGIAAFLSTAVVILFEPVRILAALDMQANSFLDAALTIVILTGGSDFVGSLLRVKGGSGVPQSAPKPLEVTGRLALGEYAEGGEKKAFTQAA
jgi:hypothetical protein